jgi:hypothetical protein
MVASMKDNTNESIGSSLPLIIGAGGDKAATFDGMLDEIRFYDAPLSLIDLQSLSNVYGIKGRYIPSSNAFLRSLTIVPATALTPAFSKFVFDYAASLPEGTTSVTVNAFPDNLKSRITGTGAVDVSSGSGTSTIVVTAEDSVTVNTYTINFTITGINEISGNGIIYYNPIENCLIFKNIDNISRVEVYNVAGIKLIERNDISDRMSLNDANLNNGVFIVKIIVGNDYSIMKFVK